MELSETGLGTTREIGVGEELLLRLPENPTTGFRWQITCSGDGELQPLDDRFELGGDALPGSAGQRVLRFVARKPGTVQLSAAYRRPWEPGSQPARQLTLTIR